MFDIIDIMDIVLDEDNVNEFKSDIRNEMNRADRVLKVYTCINYDTLFITLTMFSKDVVNIIYEYTKEYHSSITYDLISCYGETLDIRDRSINLHFIHVADVNNTLQNSRRYNINIWFDLQHFLNIIDSRKEKWNYSCLAGLIQNATTYFQYELFDGYSNDDVLSLRKKQYMEPSENIEEHDILHESNVTYDKSIPNEVITVLIGAMNKLFRIIINEMKTYDNYYKIFEKIED